MKVLSSIANRHLLVALVTLGVLNALFCMVMIARENTNGNHIAKLSDELADTNKNHQRTLDETSQEARHKNSQTAADLQQTTQVLKKVQEDLLKTQAALNVVSETLRASRTAVDLQLTTQEVKRVREDLSKTQVALNEASQTLRSTTSELKQTQVTLAEAYRKHPWLGDPKTPLPWDPQFVALSKRIEELEKAMKGKPPKKESK